MNSQQKIMEICEAVAIVQGLTMLIDQLNRQNVNNKDQATYYVTIQFLQNVLTKYSYIASTPLTGEQKEFLIPQVLTIQQLQRSAAEAYMNHAKN